MGQQTAKKYKIWYYVLLIVGLIGLFDLATRSIVLASSYKMDVGFVVLGLSFPLQFLFGAHITATIMVYSAMILGFAPLWLVLAYFFNRKSKVIENPSEENLKKLKRAKIIVWVVGVILGSFVLLGMGFALYNSASTQGSKKSLNLDVSRTVVKIRCSVEDANVVVWQGSGVLISKEGLVLTNAHVIPSPEERGRFKDCLVLVPDPDVPLNPKQLYPGHLDQYSAEPVVLQEISQQYDLALLRITGPSHDGQTSYGRWPREFPFIENIGKCDKDFKIGDHLLIYGFPAVSTYDLTATEGVLSTIVDKYTFYTSAKIDAGNSGGLAVNEQGCFVGIPEALTGGVYEQYGVIVSARAVVDFLNEFNVGI